MSILKGVFSLLSGNFVRDIGDAIDKNVTSDEERLALRNELVALGNQHQQRVHDHEERLEEQVSERHKNDMQSDSWWSKNIRPLSLVYLLTVVSILAFADSNSKEFTVTTDWIDLFKVLLIMVFTFYFSSRGLEKISTILAAKFGKKSDTA